MFDAGRGQSKKPTCGTGAGPYRGGFERPQWETKAGPWQPQKDRDGLDVNFLEIRAYLFGVKHPFSWM